MTEEEIIIFKKLIKSDEFKKLMITLKKDVNYYDNIDNTVEKQLIEDRRLNPKYRELGELIFKYFNKKELF